jgi:hypothetical protein
VFEGVGNSVDQNIEKALSAIRSASETRRDTHAETDVKQTLPLTNSQKQRIPFQDVPFVLSIGTDTIHMNTARNLAVGDFAVLGGVVTTQGVMVADLSPYVESVEHLRKRPVVSLNDNTLNVLGYGLDFYSERYGSMVSKEVEPSYHGDFFHGQSSSNVILGDYWTSYGYEQITTGEFIADESSNAFGEWDNARWTLFAGDTIDVVAGTKVDGQKVRYMTFSCEHHDGFLTSSLLFSGPRCHNRRGYHQRQTRNRNGIVHTATSAAARFVCSVQKRFVRWRAPVFGPDGLEG